MINKSIQLLSKREMNHEIKSKIKKYPHRHIYDRAIYNVTKIKEYFTKQANNKMKEKHKINTKFKKKNEKKQ